MCRNRRRHQNRCHLFVQQRRQSSVAAVEAVKPASNCRWILLRAYSHDKLIWAKQYCNGAELKVRVLACQGAHYPPCYKYRHDTDQT